MTTRTTTTTTPSTTTTVFWTESYLRNEEPKIDSALKSFCSWLVANSSVSSTTTTTTTTTARQVHPLPLSFTWDLTLALTCTRCLSKAMNRHVLPIGGNGGSNSTRLTLSFLVTPQQQQQGDNTAALVAQQQQRQRQEHRELVERVWNHEQANCAVASAIGRGGSNKTQQGKRITQTLGRSSLVMWPGHKISKMKP